MSKKPFGYWKDIENIRKSIEELNYKDGYMPTKKYFRENKGAYGLYIGICSNFKSLENCAKLLNLIYVNERKKIKWTFDFLKKELQPFFDELNNFPQYNILKERKRFDIINAIHVYYGGFVECSKLYGFDNFKTYFEEYILSEEELINELIPICEKLNHFPSYVELKKENRTDLILNIKKIDRTELAKKLNYKLLKQENGHWTIETLKNELFPILEEYNFGNRLPTQYEFKIINKEYLITIINRLGGCEKIANEFNLILSDYFKTLSNHFVASSYEIIFANFLYLNNIEFIYNKKIVETENYRYDFKIKDKENNDVYIEIWGFQNNNFHGNEYLKKKKKKIKLYNKHNFKLISIVPEFYNIGLKKINDNLITLLKENNIEITDTIYEINKLMYSESYTKDKVIDDLRNYCIENKLEKLPTKEWFHNNGFSYHMNFLDKNKIKILEISKILNIKINQKINYWNIENTLKELKDFIKNENNNEFPSQKKLSNNNHCDLIGAMQKNGGVNYFRKLLGFEEIKMNYWNEEIIIQNLKNIIINLNGEFPNQKKLNKFGGMLKSMYKFGGINYFRKLLGYKEIKNK